MGLPSRLEPEPHPVTGIPFMLAYFSTADTSDGLCGQMTASGQQGGCLDSSLACRLRTDSPVENLSGATIAFRFSKWVCVSGLNFNLTSIFTKKFIIIFTPLCFGGKGISA
jgi:hypothetical protein